MLVSLALLVEAKPFEVLSPGLLELEGTGSVDEDGLDDEGGVLLVDDEEPEAVDDTDEFVPDEGGWTVPLVLELMRPGHAVSADPAVHD